MATTATADTDPENADDATGYVAIDGTRVDIPSRQGLETGTPVRPSKADMEALRKLIEAENKRIDDYNKSIKDQKYSWKQPHVHKSMASWVQALFEEKTNRKEDHRRQAINFLSYKARDWAQKILDKMPEDQQLSICLQSQDSFARNFNPYWETIFHLTRPVLFGAGRCRHA